MFSSPVYPEPRGAASPTNRFPFPRPFHSNRCHPACPERSPRERSEGSAFLFSPIRALSVFLASPLFSYSCAHFCHNENDNLFAFRRFHTLCSKHPGWGPALVNFLVAQISDLPVLPVTSHKSPVTASALFLPPVTSHQSRVTKSFTIRTSTKRARNSRRIRTSKTQDLKPFRIRTYRKTGEGGPLPLPFRRVPPPRSKSLSIPRPSTSVLSSLQSILYPQSYCSLDRSRIHSLFNQEVCLDRFRTPHYSTLPNAAAADRPVDNGRRGWRDQHRISRR
jgi:hypothetical protein